MLCIFLCRIISIEYNLSESQTLVLSEKLEKGENLTIKSDFPLMSVTIYNAKDADIFVYSDGILLKKSSYPVSFSFIDFGVVVGSVDIKAINSTVINLSVLIFPNECHEFRKITTDSVSDFFYDCHSQTQFQDHVVCYWNSAPIAKAYRFIVNLESMNDFLMINNGTDVFGITGTGIYEYNSTLPTLYFIFSSEKNSKSDNFTISVSELSNSSSSYSSINFISTIKNMTSVNYIPRYYSNEDIFETDCSTSSSDFSKNIISIITWGIVGIVIIAIAGIFIYIKCRSARVSNFYEDTQELTDNFTLAIDAERMPLPIVLRPE